MPFTLSFQILSRLGEIKKACHLWQAFFWILYYLFEVKTNPCRANELHDGAGDGCSDCFSL